MCSLNSNLSATLDLYIQDFLPLLNQSPQLGVLYFGFKLFELI